MKVRPSHLPRTDAAPTDYPSASLRQVALPASPLVIPSIGVGADTASGTVRAQLGEEILAPDDRVPITSNHERLASQTGQVASCTLPQAAFYAAFENPGRIVDPSARCRHPIVPAPIDSDPLWGASVLAYIEHSILPSESGPPPAKYRIVHLGCGTGANSFQLSGQVVGVEGDPAKLEAARGGPVLVEAAIDEFAMRSPSERLHLETRPGLKFRLENPARSNLPDGCADLVIVDQAHNTVDVDELLITAIRIAVPGGAVAHVRMGTPRSSDAAIDFWLEHFHRDLLTIAIADLEAPTGSRSVNATLPYPAEPALRLKGDPKLDASAKVDLHYLLRQIDEIPAIKAQSASDPTFLNVPKKELRKAWGRPSRTRLISWPAQLRIARVPL
jgi:hypothetical protein